MGTRSASTSIKLDMTSNISNLLDDGTTADAKVGGQLLSTTLANGIEVNQANRAWRYITTITSGGTIDIDLFDAGSLDIGAGVGDDGLGQDWICEEIVILILRVTAGPGRLETMPSNPANPLTWMPALTVANGGALHANGALMLYNPDEDGLDVEDAASHNIRLGANGGDVTVDVIIVGRNDDEGSSSSSTVSSSSTSLSSESSSRSSSSSSSSSSVSTVSSSTISSSTISTSSSSTLSSSSQSP